MLIADQTCAKVLFPTDLRVISHLLFCFSLLFPKWRAGGITIVCSRSVEYRDWVKAVCLRKECTSCFVALSAWTVFSSLSGSKKQWGTNGNGERWGCGFLENRQAFALLFLENEWYSPSFPVSRYKAYPFCQHAETLINFLLLSLGTIRFKIHRPVVLLSCLLCHHGINCYARMSIYQFQLSPISFSLLNKMQMQISMVIGTIGM